MYFYTILNLEARQEYEHLKCKPNLILKKYFNSSVSPSILLWKSTFDILIKTIVEQRYLLLYLLAFLLRYTKKRTKHLITNLFS